MKDTLKEVLLFPCHVCETIYVIDEVYQSGKRLSSVEWMTFDQAKEKYHPMNVPIIDTGSHDWCPYCIAREDGISLDEAMKNTRKVIEKDPYRKIRK